MDNRVAVRVNLGIAPSQIPQAVAIQEIMLVGALVNDFKLVHDFDLP